MDRTIFAFLTLEIRDESQAPEISSIWDRVISCDPGVRSFVTTYDPSGICTEWGKSDVERIYRLCYSLDDLQSKWSQKTTRHRSRYNMKKAGARIRTKIKSKSFIANWYDGW